jgi:hypothetical protein
MEEDNIVKSKAIALYRDEPIREEGLKDIYLFKVS